jgi:hypothetical protein
MELPGLTITMNPGSSPPLSRGVLFEKWDGQATAATLINCDVLRRANGDMLSRVGFCAVQKMVFRILPGAKKCLPLQQ